MSKIEVGSLVIINHTDRPILKEKGIKPKDIKETMNFLNNQ